MMMEMGLSGVWRGREEMQKRQWLHSAKPAEIQLQSDGDWIRLWLELHASATDFRQSFL